MVSLKKAPKKLIAVLLTLLMLITAIPAGLYSTVFAASNDYKTVQAGEITVYLYGVASADDAKIENGKYVIQYTGGDELATGIYVDGSKFEVSETEPEIEYEPYKISLDKAWVEAQTEWIAIRCISTINIPSQQPLPNIEGIEITQYVAAYDEGTHNAIAVEGTKSGDIVTYSEDGENFNLTECPTVTEVCKKDVWVKIERDGYNDYFSQKYTAEVTKGTIDWITVKGFEGTYNPSDAAAKPAVEIIGADDTKPVVVEYSVDGGATYNDVVPTIEAPGTKEIKVKITRNNYNEYETTVTAQMYNATIENITVTPMTGIVYDGKEHPVVDNKGITGLQDGDKVYYGVKQEDGSILYGEANEVLKYVDAGEYEFYIKIERKYHNDYVTFPTAFTFTIKKATIEGITATGYTGKYNKYDILTTYDAIVSVDGTIAGDTITYSTTGNDGTYSSSNPQVRKIKDSGTYYVKIHRNDNYEDLVISVTVAIDKIIQKLTFETVLPQTYGENNKFNVLANNDAEENHDSRIKYFIVPEKTTADATIDASTGEVTYTSVGTVTVLAKTNEKEFSDYLDAQQEYEIKINYADVPEYSITTPKDIHDGYNWYSCENEEDNYVITPANGWEVIKSNNSLGQSAWDKIAVEVTEGFYDDYKVAFRNTTTKVITDLVTVPKFAIDTTNPHDLHFEFNAVNDSGIAHAINKLTFGIFCKEKTEIIVTATDTSDTSSGLSSIQLFKYDINGKMLENVTADSIDLATGIAKFYIEPNFEGTIKSEIIDKVERTTGVVLADEKNSNIGTTSGYVMIENNDPEDFSIVDSANENDVRVENVNGNTIYSGDIKFTFTVQDVDSGLNNVVATINDEGCQHISVDGSEVSSDADGKVLFADSQERKSQDRDAHEFIISTANESINATEDGAYCVNVTVTDNAGNVKTDEITVYKDNTSATISGYKFSVDKFIDVLATDDLYKAVEVTDYGFYFKKDVIVTISADDFKAKNEIASGVKSISYVAVDINGNSYEEKDVPVNDKNEISFIINKDFKGQIYAYATDKVGNEPNNSTLPISEQYDSSSMITDGEFKGYVHPNGTIVETLDKHTDTSAIEFTSIPTAQGTQNNSSNYSYKGDAKSDKTIDYIKNETDNKVPLYNNDITFGVKVTDSYSGIREVSYTIFEGSETTVKTVQIDNDGKFVDGKAEGWTVNDSVKDINLVTEMTNNIAVSGNYNDMVLLIELTDRAGNKSYDYYVFGIDKTAPSIEVEYDNNDGDSQSGTGTYFKASRTATITVSERNFNKENVNFIVKNAEGKAPSVKFVKDIKGTGNGDDTKHIFEVTYSNDGVYSFDMNYTDRAANKNTKIDYKNSLAPENFVLDKTNPTISVSYDNNEAQNDKFFKASRTATITIVEHNFDVNRVVIAQTSNLSGIAISNPSLSWVNTGDTHTATINYNNDGDYIFDITMTDKAGNKEANVNYGSSVAAKDFTIDKTYSEIVKVDGIADKGVLGLVNGDIDADAKINITINDVNLDNYNIKLTRSRILVTGESDETEDASQENIIDNPETQAENGIDVTSKFVSNASGSANATAVISIPKRDDGVKNDGLYTLTIEAKDKAGNAYDTNANIITFSVNRFGSVYTFSNDLYKLLNENDGYTQSVASTDLTVYEYNTTAISDETVEVIANNESKTLIENSDYTVNTENQQDAGSWSKNTYKIRPENFKNDGVYTLRLSSKDAASITSQTVDYDVCSATFRVDSTPADIISVNYSTDVEKMLIGDTASAKTDKLTVNFTVEDLIRLEKIEVYINDTLDKTYTYGNDFDDANTFDGGQFVINDGGAKTQSFKIVVTDKAGNVIDTANKEQYKPGYVFFDQLVVSPNSFAQFYANKALFFSSIAGVALLAGFIIFVVVKKRKKDDDEENTNPQA